MIEAKRNPSFHPETNVVGLPLTVVLGLGKGVMLDRNGRQLLGRSILGDGVTGVPFEVNFLTRVGPRFSFSGSSDEVRAGSLLGLYSAARLQLEPTRSEYPKSWERLETVSMTTFVTQDTARELLRAAQQQRRQKVTEQVYMPSSKLVTITSRDVLDAGPELLALATALRLGWEMGAVLASQARLDSPQFGWSLVAAAAGYSILELRKKLAVK